MEFKVKSRRNKTNFQWKMARFSLRIVFLMLSISILLITAPVCDSQLVPTTITTTTTASTIINSNNHSSTGAVRVSRRQTTLLLQRFLVEPDNLTVDIGETVTLPCRVSNKAGTVQWTRDGFGLGTDPRLEGFPTYSMLHNDATGDYSLKISSVTLEDDATFQCQIGALDSVPGIRSQNAKLTVRVQPESPVIVLGNFVNAPASSQEVQVLSTTAGTKIELICEAHGGRPAAELSWLNSRNRPVKKGITSTITPMNDGKRFNSALKWVFEPTKSDHNKKVTCRSTHPTLANHSTASILLEVKYAPEVKLDVSRITVAPNDARTPSTTPLASGLHGRAGDTLLIKCLAEGNPGKDSLTYEWYKSGELITGDHREELVLDNIDKSFNGVEIKCQVSNSVGVGKAIVKLNVAYGPSFLPSMQYVYGVTSGDTVRIGCMVDGNPSPEITWIKVGSSNVMSTGSKLTVRNVNQDQVGEYLCRASVKGFSEISAIVYLRINGPPKIRKKKSHNYAVQGESGHLDCTIESVPAPIAITWIHNGQVFTSSSGNNIPTNIDIHEEQLPQEAVAIKASFDIRTTLQTDYGHYNCVVVNKYGSDWHVVTLTEQTSFSAIVVAILISISILVFVVLSTIIVLLSMKHRKLVKSHQQQDNSIDSKKHYLSGDDSDNHHNIYSTTASTRTNSSSEKTAAVETGTIITRSGSTGSPRSSTSSFPAFMESTHSPGPSQHHSHSHHPHYAHLSSPHHLQSSPFPDPPQSPFFNSMFEIGSSNAAGINHSTNYNPTLNDDPTGNSYSTLGRHAMSPQMATSHYSLVPMYHYPSQGVSPGFSVTGRDLYQASPYQVMPTSNQIKSHMVAMPTPPPSLTKELDSCISKSSIATHV